MKISYIVILSLKISSFKIKSSKCLILDGQLMPLFSITFYYFLVNVKLFVELLITYLHKLLKETAMMKELIFGLWVFYCINLRVEWLLSKQKIKISHMKKLLKVNALTHNFSVMILNILLTKFLIKIHQKDQILIKFNNINGLKNTRQQEDSFGKIFGQLGIA